MPRVNAKKVEAKDREMFNVIAKIGWVSESQANQFFGVKSYRLEQYAKRNKLAVDTDKITGEKYYKLHQDLKDNKREMKSLCGVVRAYSAKTIHHDKAIVEKYFELRAKGNLVEFRSESDLQKMFKDKIKKMERNNSATRVGEERFFANELKELYKNNFISTPDCYYVVQQEDGTTYSTCFESVTYSYVQSDIDAKFAFCQLFNMQIECHEVK